jgi:hypothetical protein
VEAGEGENDEAVPMRGSLRHVRRRRSGAKVMEQRGELESRVERRSEGRRQCSPFIRGRGSVGEAVTSDSSRRLMALMPLMAVGR